jgi:tripeptidyl-peptidase-1
MKARRMELTERQNLPNVTPQLIFERYNITLGTTDLKVNNTQAVWEFTDSYDPQDLASFFEQFSPALKGQKVAGIRGNFGNQPGTGDAEAALDIEYIMAVGTYSPSYFYNYNDSDIFHAFLDWVDDLANDPRPPLIHSVSYGEYGGDYPIGWVDKVSNEWMKLGSRGITVFVASGDDGVGCNDNCTGFQFPYPSSPWITLVGSSQLQQVGNGYYEIGSDFSSGGFSNDFGMPKWQQTAVQYYLNNAKDLPPRSFFNATGRALPDVAAVGENVQIVLGGEVQPVDGTSCSSPIFAGMISLLNGWRMSNGKSPLGFINPILYDAYAADATTFWDVTVGNNTDGCCPGFPAWKGWDGVTGLGTPNFKKLFEYVQKLK